MNLKTQKETHEQTPANTDWVRVERKAEETQRDWCMLSAIVIMIST